MIIIIILIGNFSIPKILVLRILNPGISVLAKLGGIHAGIPGFGIQELQSLPEHHQIWYDIQIQQNQIFQDNRHRGTFLQGPLYIPDFIGGLEGTKKIVTLLRVIIPFGVDAY